MGFRWLSQRCFNAIHQSNLVYNTCWEDPHLDRQALELRPSDTVCLITSAGCNALDYALQQPAEVHAVDLNPLQNALLELKITAIRYLDHADVFQLFGLGRHPDWRHLYYDQLRPNLAKRWCWVWDRRINFFDGSHRRRSFYFRGTSGLFAWLINRYLDRSAELRSAVTALLNADSIEHQREIYSRYDVDRLLFNRPMRWMLRRDTTMAMLGVPRSQRMQIERQYPGGIAEFIQDRIRHVFQNTSLKQNYFWRVYLTGAYTPQCCPEYLKRENHGRLRGGLLDRITTHTSSISQFLRDHDGAISRFVLLDHMDWLYERSPEALQLEWQAIVNRATDSARVLWRSAAMNVDFVDPLEVKIDGRSTVVGQLLRYKSDLSSRLHVADRVNTYGSFYIADLQKDAA
ncbi:MAG: BtaA family protein [Planctomycetota bacterium]